MSEALLEQVRGQVDAVLADRLYWFPVRHHSPNTARHLRDVLRARRPKLVLIEGPPDCNGLVEHVVAAKTKPPVALYTSWREGDARFASWYPLLPYSPEYVALRTARELGADVVFVDLPHYAIPETPEEPTEAAMAGSSFFQALARAAGYRTFDEAWDSLFELRPHPDAEAFRRDLATFCAASRATTDPARISSDGTLPRERFMWRTIRAELARRQLDEADAIVVCGGFHLFLDRQDPEPPPPIQVGTVYATVAPYSYFRTSELAGYGAGNRAPRYYQRLWEALEAGRSPDDAMVEEVCAALAAGRKAGEALSSADAVSIAQVSRGLAALRRRPFPSLDDVHDAIVTCCCKGDPRSEGEHLLRAIGEAAVGTAVGRVTDAIGRLPLVHDFHNQLHDLDLGEVVGRDRRTVLELDRRDPLAARRSAFLHRVAQIGIPLAELADPGGAGTVFKEKWRASWSPKVEQALIEHNLYGDSVEAAAAARLEEEVAQQGAAAGEVVGRWRRAVDMDLPALALRLEQTCGAAIDADRRVGSLAQALHHLQVLERHAAFRGLRRDVLEALAVRAFGRACFAVPDAANVPDEEQPGVLGALSTLAEALLASDGRFDRTLFATNVQTAATLTTSPFLRGAFLGVLSEIREIPPDALAAEISAYARSRPEARLEAGPFLEGVFVVSRTSILLGADALVGAIEELLRAADWDAFVGMLPRLRHAFERLHERQRASFADRVAARHGLADGEVLVTLQTSVGAAVAMAQIDARVAAIMAEWDA